MKDLRLVKGINVLDYWKEGVNRGRNNQDFESTEYKRNFSWQRG
jgi:hypothetical protein